LKITPKMSHEIGDALAAAGFSHGVFDRASRRPAAIACTIRSGSSSPAPTALSMKTSPSLEEMRAIRPGVKCIVSWPITALRTRSSLPCVPGCSPALQPPFDSREIVNLARKRRLRQSMARRDIHVSIGASPPGCQSRVNCRLITAERLMTFAKELSAQLPEDTRHEMMQAFARDPAERDGAWSSVQSRTGLLKSPQSALEDRSCSTYATLALASVVNRSATQPLQIHRMIPQPTSSSVKNDGMRPGWIRSPRGRRHSGTS